jgi:hypothetical protein
MDELNRLKIAIFMVVIISGLFFLLAIWKIEQQKEEINYLRNDLNKQIRFANEQFKRINEINANFSEICLDLAKQDGEILDHL